MASDSAYTSAGTTDFETDYETLPSADSNYTSNQSGIVDLNPESKQSDKPSNRASIDKDREDEKESSNQSPPKHRRKRSGSGLLLLLFVLFVVNIIVIIFRKLMH